MKHYWVILFQIASEKGGLEWISEYRRVAAR